MGKTEISVVVDPCLLPHPLYRLGNDAVFFASRRDRAFYRNNMRAELSDPRAFQQEFIDRGLLPEDQPFEWTDTFTPHSLNFGREKNRASIEEIVDFLVPISDRDIWIAVQEVQEQGTNGFDPWFKYKLTSCGSSYCLTGDVTRFGEGKSFVPDEYFNLNWSHYDEVIRHCGFRIKIDRSFALNSKGKMVSQIITISGPATNIFAYYGRGLTPYGKTEPYAAAPFYKVSTHSPKDLFNLKDGTYDPIVVTRY